MKVALILSQSSGGLPHYTAQLANALTEHIEVGVFKPNDTSADDIFNESVVTFNTFENLSLSLVEINQGNVPILDTLKGMYSYKNLGEIREFDPDIVHIPVNLFPQVQFMMKLLRLDRDYPTVVTYHEVFPNSLLPNRPLPGIIHHWLNMVLPNVDEQHTVVHTQDAKQILLNRGYSTSAISVLDHPAYDFFNDDQSEEQDTDCRTILFFGNIVDYKNLDLLTSAVVESNRQIDNIKCIIAGDGRISEAATTRIKQNPDLFEIHNEFIPNEEIGSLFSRADLLALPYRSRDGKMGHSGVQTIAHTFGIPIVATDVGMFREMIEKNSAGLVVPQGDVSRFADSMVKVLSEKSLRREMGKNSQKMASDLTWEDFARKHINIYMSVQ